MSEPVDDAHTDPPESKAASAAASVTKIAVAAASGAKAGAAGAVMSGVKAAATDRNGRKVLLGLIALSLAPVLIGSLVVMGLLSSLSSTPTAAAATLDKTATSAAAETGIEESDWRAHKAAVSGLSVPWYVLTAIDYTTTTDQDTNPYGLAEDANWPTDLRAGGARIASTLQSGLQESLSRGDSGTVTDEDGGEEGQSVTLSGNADAWRLLAGVSKLSDGTLGVDPDDTAAAARHEANLKVYADQIAKLPITGAASNATAIALNAYKLAVGQPINGCGTTGVSTVAAAAGAWVNPVKGTRSSPFGMRLHPVTGIYKLHSGTDASAPLGTPIYAAAAGTVTYAGHHPSCSDSACGAVIEIDHGGGILTRYLHTDYSDHKVHVGDQVQAGQQISAVNTLGFSTGPHLHFEVLVDGKFIDPIPFLAERDVQFATGPTGSDTGSAGGAGLVTGGDKGKATSTDTGSGDPLSVINADPNASYEPFSSEAAAKIGITAPVTLANADGDKVSVSVEAQYNVAVAVQAVRNASWPGISEADKTRLAVAAIITMAQESTFGTNPSITSPNGDGDAGPYQQRAKVGWYADGTSIEANAATLQNIAYATLTFIEGHKVAVAGPTPAGAVGYRIPGALSKNWRTMEPHEIAVAVQVPASWTAVYYEKFQPVAEALVAAASGMTVNGGSGSGCADASTGSGAAEGYSTQNPGPWGGYSEGQIPESKLCTATLGSTSVKLRCDAARALEVTAEEFTRFGGGGSNLAFQAGSSGYVSGELVALAPAMHGWGLAVELDTGTAAYSWLVKEASTHGWRQVGSDKGHFEYFAPSGDIATGWELGLKPAAVAVGRYVEANYSSQAGTLGGWRQDTTNDHPSGRAVDIMIPDYTTTAGNELGWKIAKDLQANAEQLGISYLIFDQKIWSVARDREGWRHYNAFGTDDSATHRNHVHANTG